MPSPRFDQAIRCITAGDAARLRQLLRAEPDLVRARSHQEEPPYDGYFRHATLLHHTTGNPLPEALPPNVVELAALLLDAGADVDAETHFGNWSWTALGLVASGAVAHRSGLWRPLIDLFLDRGADIDRRNGLALYGALYHVVEHRGQREVAAYLVERGARVDLAGAAAVGAVERLPSFFDQAGRPTTQARIGYRADERNPGAPDSRLLLDEALVFAAAHDRTESAAWLLERGAEVNGFAPFGRARVTPLHAAAWSGWPEMCGWLLDHRADPTLRDEQHRSTPLGWAGHSGRSAALEKLRSDESRLDDVDAILYASDDEVARRLPRIDPNGDAGFGFRGVYLRAAVQAGRLQVVEQLLAAGAIPHLANGEGRTPLTIARDAGHDEILARLGRALRP